MVGKLRIEPQKRYTAEEAGKLLGVTRDTVKGYCRTGKLAGKQVGPKKIWTVLGKELQRLRREWRIDDAG